MQDVTLPRSYVTTAAVGFPLLLVAVLAGAAGNNPMVADEITVQRLNVVEPDGSLKMVISNSALQHPGTINGDTLMPGRLRPAGVIFFDDDGDEMGGLVLTGDDTTRFGGMLLDQLNNDESVRLVSQQAVRGEKFLHQGGLSITDRDPDYPLPRMVAVMKELEALPDDAARKARMAELGAPDRTSMERLFVGRRSTGEVLVDLRDGKGRSRLRMIVDTAGAARIEFLDAAGTVQRTLEGAAGN